MKANGKKEIAAGAALLLGFILWTVLIRHVDVQPVGVNGTDIGFATVNVWLPILYSLSPNKLLVF